MDALELGYNEPQNLYLVYKAPEDPIDAKTVEPAKDADVALVFVGTDENTATEEADRLTLLLPGNQVDLIKAVAAVNPNTIVVMQTLGCVEVEDFRNIPNLRGIVWTGYNGQAQGDAIAKVLFGDVNPGGKLNATWFKSVNDLAPITDYTLRGQKGDNGRTLWYFDKPVSYEFGYGLSYTTFEYSNFAISKTGITPEDRITVSVDVTNTGSREGDEVVQIYLTTPDSPASLQRPVKRLKGFKRVTIPRGQTKTVSIPVECKDLWFWDPEKDRITFDSGRYVFEIGASSKDIRGTVSATMDGRWEPNLKVVVADCGKSVLKSGETMKARATASLTDDSFLDTGKASISWSSNNPKVVSVAPDGTLKANSTGVATIKCTVTYKDKAVSGDFAVKVMPDLSLSSLSVGGKNVKTGTSRQYCFLSSKASAKAPVVAATAADPSVKVKIKQASAVPGTAVITVMDEMTSDSREYSVNIGVPAKSDDFKALGSQWNWVREDKAGWTVKNGALTLKAGTGDIDSDSNNVSNLLLQDANSDWVVTTKLSCGRTPGMPAQNAGLVACQDDDNFVKFVYAAAVSFRRQGGDAAPAAGQLRLNVEEGGWQKTEITLSMNGILDSDVVWLRLAKKGSSYTASYSKDGRKFTEAGVAEAVLKDIKAGLIAAEGVMPARMRMFGGAMPQTPAEPFEVSFDNFTIKSSGL